MILARCIDIIKIVIWILQGLNTVKQSYGLSSSKRILTIQSSTTPWWKRMLKTSPSSPTIASWSMTLPVACYTIAMTSKIHPSAPLFLSLKTASSLHSSTPPSKILIQAHNCKSDIQGKMPRIRWRLYNGTLPVRQSKWRWIGCVWSTMKRIN